MRVEQQISAGQKVLARRKAERRAYTRFPAFSRVLLEDATGRQHVFWLVERFVGDLHVQRTWSGTAVGGVAQGSALDEGNVVSKNAPFGLLLDEYGERVGDQLPLPVGLQDGWGGPRATVIGCTHYIPRGEDAINGSMYVEAEAPLNFSSLREFVAELNELITVDVTPDLSAEIGEIEVRLQAQKRRYRAFREAKRARIRHVITNAALRNQPKLDSDQLRVKQLQILDGQVIIEGGPGTGKTTTLLDRINLLTDPAIREHLPDLSDAALVRLTDPAKAYRLFTPDPALGR